MNEEIINRKPKESDRLINDFLSVVSHELRTPIAIIKEGISLCLEGVAGEINDKQKELLSATQENIDRLNHIVTNLLDVSKIEAGKMVLKRASVDITNLIQKVIDSYQASAKEKCIHLEKQMPDRPLVIYVDSDKVAKIFSNLVDNALKFTEAGGQVTLGVQDGDSFITCWVADTGSGVTEENGQELFSKFKQIKRKDGPGYQGTGLGLAIAKGLVEKHQGEISMQSELGKGTEFRFTLKKVPFPKILIVNDETNEIEVLKEYLIKEQYRIIETGNGLSALKIARKDPPDLIFIDMEMPAMNGYELIGRLRSDNRTKHCPIAVTGDLSLKNMQTDTSIAQTAFPVLAKPFDKRKLLNLIKAMLVH